MKKKTKKTLVLLSFLSIGTFSTSVLTPFFISNNQNHNSNISISKSDINSYAYNGITNIASVISANSILSSKYPIELLISSENESLLKDLIISSVVDPASKLNHNDIQIDKNKSIANNLDGTLDLVFDIVNFKVVDTNGSQLVTIQSKTFKTKVDNLQVATPSNVPGQGSQVLVPTQFNNYTNIQAISKLNNEILPSVIGGTQIPTFSIDLRKAEPIFPDKLSITMVVGNYFGPSGEFINYSGLVNFTLTGFSPLVNSSFKSIIDASSLNIDSDHLTLQNSFELISKNINNLAKPLTIDDIANFSISHLYSEREATLSFDIINNLWIEDGLVESKNIEMTFYNLLPTTRTTINSVIKTSLISAYTSSEIKATSYGDWLTNSTIKSIIASAINSPAPDTVVSAVDIQITNVKELGSVGNNNYSKLQIDFNLINFSGVDQEGQIIESIPFTTTIEGFKTLDATRINSKILAKTLDNSNIGISVYNNIYATDLSKDQAKSIIASNIINPNGLVSPNDIDIVKYTPNLNTATIDVEFNLINNKFVDGQGSIINSQKFVVQLFGFKFFEGPTLFSNLSNNKQLSNNTDFVTPIVLPSISLASNVQFMKGVVRSLIQGPVPNNLSIDINNINTSVPNQLSFDTTITNYYSSTGVETTPKIFTGIRITDLPSNPITGTFNLPIVPVKNTSSQEVITIDDFRPEGSSFNKLKQLLIDKAIKNPFIELKPNDIEITPTGDNAPIFSAVDSTITVTFKIINNKYKDPTTQQATNSPELKVKFVGFSSSYVVNVSNYAMESILNPAIGNEYPSEFLKNKINVILNNDIYSLYEKNILLQNTLSEFVKINISNLDLNNTRLDFSVNDHDGSITIRIYSSNFYSPQGNYMSTETLITQYVLRGFATINQQSETFVTWKSVEPLNIFASDLSLLNVSEFLTLNNLPVGVQPSYRFVARDTIVEQGNLLDYGEVDIVVSLDSYFDNNGKLINGKKEFNKTFKTLPFLNTSLAYVNGTNNVILNSNDRGVIASEAKYGTIKSIIARNLLQTPSDFNINVDIEILDKPKPNDEKGTLEVSFILKKYYKDGKIIDGDSPQFNVIIEGFYKVEHQASKKSNFYEEQWFILLISVTGGSILLLIIIIILSKIALNRRRR